MLIQLQIKNLVLIPSATLSFKEGLHIFSGETGAGKTALFQALQLISGARFEQQFVRKGEEKASVTAKFKLPPHAAVFEELKQAAFEVDPTEELVIHRELTSEGKSKILINYQWAPLYLLKEIAPFVLHIVSQQASQKLLDLSSHLTFLDEFAGHKEKLECLKEKYNALKETETKLKEKESALKLFLTQKESLQETLQDIEEGAIQSEDEEEVLFQDYQSLSTANERLTSLSEITHTLYDSENSAYSSLLKQLPQLAKWTEHHPDLKEAHQALLNLSEELKEHLFTLLHHRDQIDEDPKRLSFLEDRLSILNRLKKKYGPSLKDVLLLKQKLQEQLGSLEMGDEELSKLRHQIEEQKETYTKAADALSKSRQKSARLLENKLKFYFDKLNLSQAKLVIQQKEVSFSALGKDEIEFHLQANPGEHPAPLRKRASGGELSRVLLALKLLSTRLENATTVLFDEVDSNLGGETASKIGQLLLEVSQGKQAFCITHHPQVAIYGQHHFKIEKKSKNNRTESSVTALNEEERIKEIERMLGGEGLSQKAGELARDLIQSST